WEVSSPGGADEWTSVRRTGFPIDSAWRVDAPSVHRSPQERTPLVSLRRSLLGACALIAALAVAAPAQARMINTTFRYDTDTNNCDTGEQVLYTQTLHIVAKTEIVDGEETVVWARFDPLEAQGTGVESGDHYQISTKSISIDHPFNAAQPLTLVGQFHVIDTGSGADFMI